jgi:hypothetical protein
VLASLALKGDKVPASSPFKGRRGVLASSLLLEVKEESQRARANCRVFVLIVKGGESSSLVIVMPSLN